MKANPSPNWKPAQPLLDGLAWTEEALPEPPTPSEVAAGLVPPYIVAEIEAYTGLFGSWPWDRGWRDRLDLVQAGMRIKDREDYVAAELAKRMRVDWDEVIRRAEDRAARYWLGGGYNGEKRSYDQ